MFRKIFRFLLFVTIPFASNLIAFEDNDQQYWTISLFEKTINPKIKIYAMMELKWAENWSNYYHCKPDGGITWVQNDRHSLSLAFKEIHFHNAQDEWARLRTTYIKSVFKGDVQKLPYQLKNQMEYQIRENSKNIYRLRSKLSLYSPRTFWGHKPYIADEVFWDFNADTHFRFQRFYAGVVIKIFDQLSVDTYFLQQQKNNNPWLTWNAFGTTFKYSF